MSAKIIQRTLIGILVSGMAWASTAFAAEKLEIATFAGGCFWCVESDFDGAPGVVKTISGYTGGLLKDPTKTSYEKLLDVLWHSIDPTDAGGQFCDRGQPYETAVFTHSPEQKRIAEQSKKKLMETAGLKKPIVTPVRAARPFYPAETYHQDYYKKNPLRYKVYRYGCGRDARLKELWGKEAHRGIEKH